MANDVQLSFDIIDHMHGGEVIRQRSKDGYINATAMCRAAGREWSKYRELKATREFLPALGLDLRLTEVQLIIGSYGAPGGDPRNQGTWVHPQIAIDLAQWLSADFKIKVTRWVMEWMSARPAPATAPGQLPYHIRRYLANQGGVPAGHFSILTELTLCLVAPMEALGYHLPEKMWPDISSGMMFAKFLRDEHGIDTKLMPSYIHYFEDGRKPVQANAYPERLLPYFRAHFREVWLPQRAPGYFAERDGLALQYLPRLLGSRAA
jgi:hypothetical protein